MEANEWKKKYEETRQEVLEMRLDWRFAGGVGTFMHF